MSTVYRLPNGSFQVLDANTNTMRPLKPEEAGNVDINIHPTTTRQPHMLPVSQLDETQGGTSVAERLLLKSFGGPGSRATLEKWGYEVKDLPDSYGANNNFAVRKRGEAGPWRPLDPRVGHGGFSELLWDLGDLVTDTVSGSLTAGAATAGGAAGLAAGGPLGAVAGAVGAGGAAGGALEGVRQGIGSALGVENNFDPTGIAMNAAVSGAVPLAGAAGGAVLRKVAPQAEKIALGYASSVLGLPASAKGSIRSAEDWLKSYVTDSTQKFPGVFRTGLKAVQVIHALGDRQTNPFPERALVDRDITAATAQGVVADFAPVLDEVRKVLATPGPEVAETATKRSVVQTVAKTSRTAASDASSATKSATTGQIDRVGTFTNNLKKEKGIVLGPQGQPLAGSPKEVPFDTTTKLLQGNQSDLRNTTARAASASSESAASREATTTRTTFKPSETLSPEGSLARLGGMSQPQASKLLSDMRGAMGNVNADSVPIARALQIKGVLQDILRGTGHYNEKPIEKPFVDLVSRAEEKLRVEIARGMENAGFMDYRPNMEIVDHKMRILNGFRKLFGMDGKPPKPEALQARSAARYIARVYNDTESEQAKGSTEGALALLDDLEKHFGVDLRSDTFRANVGRIVGKRAGKSTPRFTATGNVMMLGGGVIGGVPGAVAGATLATPRVLTGLLRGGYKASDILRRIASSKGGGAVSPATIATLQEAVRAEREAISPTVRDVKKPSQMIGR